MPEHQSHLAFTVPGRPRVKARGRARSGIVYTPPATRAAEKVIVGIAAAAWRYKHPMDGGPVAIRCDFYSTGWCGDLDNLAKLVLDALQKAQVIQDDRHVWQLQLNRHACTRDQQRTVVVVQGPAPA